jgi:hypothetical protein
MQRHAVCVVLNNCIKDIYLSSLRLLEDVQPSRALFRKESSDSRPSHSLLLKSITRLLFRVAWLDDISVAECEAERNVVDWCEAA